MDDLPEDYISYEICSRRETLVQPHAWPKVGMDTLA